MGIIGPSLLLFMRQSQNQKVKNTDLLHLILPVAGVILKLTTPSIRFSTMYISMTGIIGLYIIYTAYKHFTNMYESKDFKKYNSMILIAVTLIWLSFAYQHISETLLNYAYGSGFASLVIYALSINKMSKSLILQDSVKSKTILPESVLNTIKAAFEVEKIYLRRGITLNQFSDEFGIQLTKLPGV